MDGGGYADRRHPRAHRVPTSSSPRLWAFCVGRSSTASPTAYVTEELFGQIVRDHQPERALRAGQRGGGRHRPRIPQAIVTAIDDEVAGTKAYDQETRP
jgi:hypothetical protein